MGGRDETSKSRVRRSRSVSRDYHTSHTLKRERSLGTAELWWWWMLTCGGGWVGLYQEGTGSLPWWKGEIEVFQHLSSDLP